MPRQESIASVIYASYDRFPAPKGASVHIDAFVRALRDAARAASEDPALWAGEILAAYGPDGSPGNELPITGLDPWEGSDHIATVTIITDETTTDSELGCNLGMPRDLDGDGLASNSDVTNNASLLPAIVDVRWRHAGGAFEVRQAVYLLRF